MANISRLEYKKDGLAQHEKGELVVSTDMQKVVMLPRLPGLKQAIFCRRLVVFHQTFAPIGTFDEKTVEVIWHEGISGRSAKDVASAYIKFVENMRDVKKIYILVR